MWTKSFKPAHEKEFCYFISTPEKERKRGREGEKKVDIEAVAASESKSAGRFPN